ncbi:MAG TPA: DUF4252 domain-containing protein [Pyrinomonadaceae bacterium]|nr:DUF4252 domain-containing protein [Pyrinomonadaceae bacterium]
MTKKNRLFLAVSLLFLVFAFSASPAFANGNEYNAVVNHLKTKYKAKKVKVPFMWLARFAVKVVRPAGVKSFSVTLFEDLNFSRDTLDAEMQAVMRNSLSKDWNPIFRVRSKNGQQAYMYIREAGDSVKIMLVTIDNNQAAVIRAKFNPEKLIEFMNNPKILGVSLNDDEQKTTEN